MNFYSAILKRLLTILFLFNPYLDFETKIVKNGLKLSESYYLEAEHSKFCKSNFGHFEVP